MLFNDAIPVMQRTHLSDHASEYDKQTPIRNHSHFVKGERLTIKQVLEGGFGIAIW